MNDPNDDYIAFLASSTEDAAVSQPGRIAKLYVGWNIPFLMFLPVIAVLLGFHVRKTTIERNLDYKKRALTIVLAMCIFLVIAGICEKKTDAPWYFCVFGALLLFFSYHTMRRARKMGITWEQEGKPASEVASQHFGAMTLILGFYFIWVGTNGVVMDGVVGSYVTIFMDYRAWLVFVAAFGIIVPSSMALDFAFDQGSKPIPLAFADMYKLDGRTCREVAGRIPYFSAGPIGEWMETPWPLFGGWMLFGLCAFMPFGNGASFQKTMAFIICCMIGVVYTARLLPAYWNRDAGYKRWTYVYYAGMVFLFTAIGVDGQGPLVASMVGAILVLLGQHVELFEKKKGKYWIEQGEDSPRPEVAYSVGHPVYVLGWLLLCLGMSIPML